MSGWAVQFCLWSMNPATAFNTITATSRSIILTSGTLSPLDSFASEVGLDLSYLSSIPAFGHHVEGVLYNTICLHDRPDDKRDKDQVV